MKIQYCIKIWPVFYGWLTYCSSPTDTSFFLHILISKVAHSLKDMPLSAEQWILGEILAKQLKRIWRWWSFGCLISTFFLSCFWLPLKLFHILLELPQVYCPVWHGFLKMNIPSLRSWCICQYQLLCPWLLWWKQ